ncbi:MAG: RNA methyltransferase [Magnetococcales bacterium]|nr:RNA methyltransferase [Magnetococcales bacterium]MBF0438532.1 RNA methyltransferase [Magnetococcales bacterium]
MTLEANSAALKNLVVILDRPAHGGNVGAVARAMGNTGFSRLRLVAPRQFPHPEADAFAVGCQDILQQAEIFSDVASAVADVHYLVATTNRSRGQRQIVYTPRELAAHLPERFAQPDLQVGILFGTERTGLVTEDVERASVICNIPTCGEQGSLNLAQAVLIILYEVMLGLGQSQTMAYDPLQEDHLASATDMDRLFLHMEETLTTIGFIKPRQKRHMMGSLKAIFQRAGLDRREVAILRGIWHEVIAFRGRG